jgi:hypothetical protein
MKRHTKRTSTRARAQKEPPFITPAFERKPVVEHIEEQPPGERRVPSRMGEGEIPLSGDPAEMPSYAMFDNVECIQRARIIAGDP